MPPIATSTGSLTVCEAADLGVVNRTTARSDIRLMESAIVDWAEHFGVDLHKVAAEIL
jgi:hypothetical protein